MLTTAQWAAYKRVIDTASESFNQDIVLWRRQIRRLPRYGEDDPNTPGYDDINLNALIAFNVFRTWPMTDETPSGALDKENIVMILNKEYLRGLGYLNAAGFFDMDPGQDIFIHRGITYRSAGETEVSQAGDDPLMFYIVLSREESNTGDSKY